MALLALAMIVKALPGCAPIVEVRIDGRAEQRLDLRWSSAESVGGIYQAEHLLQLSLADRRIHRLEMCLVASEPAPTHEILFYATRFRPPSRR
jgi:hypothetical protein